MECTSFAILSPFHQILVRPGSSGTSRNDTCARLASIQLSRSKHGWIRESVLGMSLPQSPEDAKAYCIDDIPISSLPPSPARPLTSPGDLEKSKAVRPNLWKILRDAVGTDLTRLTLPVYFNEPLSFLQRVAEDVEHSQILDRAADKKLAGTADRAALVAAFVISHYGATLERTGKPFNPLLGETFDYVDTERSLALVTEQVCHHPPISAIHAAGRGWTYHTAYEVRSRFHANSLEVWPEGVVHVHFADGGHFTYEQARTFVNNIVMGSLWIDNGGHVNILDVADKRFDTSIKMKRCTSMFADNRGFGAVSGEVRNIGESKAVRKISGNWRKEVRVDGDVVWTAGRRAKKDETGGHVMTAWAWLLNCPIPESERSAFPKTDSRLRPDERAFEEGRYSHATLEKDRLEKAQRERQKTVGLSAEDDGAKHDNARWFALEEDTISGRSEWHYQGGYFKSKLQAVNGVPWPVEEEDIF